MADLNLCAFIGRLGRDPELRYMPNGDAACSVSIAVGKKWKDKNSGEMKEQTTWVPLSFFGKTAELLCKYSKKGNRIRVTGEFSVRQYTDKQSGNEKTMTEIRVQDLQIIDFDESAGGGAAPARARAPATAPAAAPKPAAAGGAHDDDIPF